MTYLVRPTTLADVGTRLTRPATDYFYVNQNSTPVDYPELALAYQDKIIDFVHGKDIDWPLYGETKRMCNITGEFMSTTLSKDLQDRCNFINSMVLDKKNGA